MSKSNFIGFLKILAGLALCLPGPAGLATGITLTVVGDVDGKAVYTEYKQTADYKTAIDNKGKYLAALEEDKQNGEISEIIYESNKSYYNEDERFRNHGYMDDCILASDYGARLTRDENMFYGGVAICTPFATAIGVSFTVLFNAFHGSRQGIIKDLILDGAYEMTEKSEKKEKEEFSEEQE